jgi:hypothetical protein
MAKKAKKTAKKAAKKAAKKKPKTAAENKESRKASAMTTPVVMGIIDDGIAFAHQQFRSGLKTRVEYWWLQDGVPQPDGAVQYGRELDKKGIDDILGQCVRAGEIEEDEVYRRAGLLDFARSGQKAAAWRIAHGTHVMDLACGGDPNAPPDDRPIICVQLPTKVTADTSGFRLYPYVHHAMRYILHRSLRIAQARGYAALPIVINLSYGNFAGPHDGTSPIERAMDHLVAKAKKMGVQLRIILPAGNSYDLRTHASVKFANLNDEASFYWHIPPDCRRPSFLEIWLPPFDTTGAADRVHLTITSPTGEQREVPEILHSMASWRYAAAYYEYRTRSARGLFLIAVDQTAGPSKHKHPLAPCGTWRLKLKNVALKSSDMVQAWVQRDDTLRGYPIRGRQSHLTDWRYTRFDSEGRLFEQDLPPESLIKRASTLNAIATGQEPVVVGGFLRKQMVDVNYSSAGPTANPPRPDAVTVTEDSRVHFGVLAAGSRSGSVVPLGGTSVAAPQIARLCANDLATGGNGDRAFVQYRAQYCEQNYPGSVPAASRPPPKVPDRDGDGRILLAPYIPIKRFDDW